MGGNVEADESGSKGRRGTEARDGEVPTFEVLVVSRVLPVLVLIFAT